MSYALAIAGDARSDLRAPDPWLQEEVLDEREMIADDPSVLPTAGPEGDISYSFSRSLRGIRYFFAAVLGRNDKSQILTLLGISYQAPPLPT